MYVIFWREELLSSQKIIKNTCTAGRPFVQATKETTIQHSPRHINSYIMQRCPIQNYTTDILTQNLKEKGKAELIDTMPGCSFDLLDASERQLRHFLALAQEEPLSEEMSLKSGTVEHQYNVQIVNGRFIVYVSH